MSLLNNMVVLRQKYEKQSKKLLKIAFKLVFFTHIIFNLRKRSQKASVSVHRKNIHVLAYKLFEVQNEVTDVFKIFEELYALALHKKNKKHYGYEKTLSLY